MCTCQRERAKRSSQKLWQCPSIDMYSHKSCHKKKCPFSAWAFPKLVTVTSIGSWAIVSSTVLLYSALFCFHLILSCQSFCRAVRPSHTSQPSRPLCSQTRRSSSLPEEHTQTLKFKIYPTTPTCKLIWFFEWKEQLNETESDRDKIWNVCGTIVRKSCLAPRASSSSSEAAAHAFQNWVRTYPNMSTQNESKKPEKWKTLRSQPPLKCRTWQDK